MKQTSKVSNHIKSIKKNLELYVASTKVQNLGISMHIKNHLFMLQKHRIIRNTSLTDLVPLLTTRLVSLTFLKFWEAIFLFHQQA